MFRFVGDEIKYAWGMAKYFAKASFDRTFGKITNAASKADDKLYVQVTESMKSEDVRARELRPLQAIRDNYEKIVLTLDTCLNASYDGIKSLDLIEWLLDV